MNQFLEKINSWQRNVFIFDFDGTLLNSEPCHFLSHKKVIENLFPDKVFTTEDFKKFVGRRDVDIFEEISTWGNIDKEKAMADKQKYSLAMLKKKEVKIFDYFFAITKAFPHAHYFIASNQDENSIKQVLKTKKVDKFFDKVFSMPSLNLKKEQFLENIKQFINVLPEQIVLFEDSSSTLSLGKRLGMKTVGIKNDVNTNQKFDCDLEIDCTQKEILGRVNSVESMGLVDGPGIRFVSFLQGCHLRCKYCHNPETWAMQGQSEQISAQELVKKIEKYKNYYGSDGGATFSGGEPLLQPRFLLECLRLCKQKGINTALDTAGVGFGDYEEILKYVDLVILDVKAVDEKEYSELTGQPIKYFEHFLKAVQKSGNKLWLRQVIVPGINDDEKHVLKLKEFAKNLNNVEKVELLPYKTIGVHKYQELKIPYRLKEVPEMDEERCKRLERLLK